MDISSSAKGVGSIVGGIAALGAGSVALDAASKNSVYYGGGGYSGYGGQDTVQDVTKGVGAALLGAGAIAIGYGGYKAGTGKVSGVANTVDALTSALKKLAPHKPV